ncbi:MAG: DMT family transporter, partial [Gammaproteobacteria bacterium]|nr:DMT family transporter [Gammaproteobacteria bacterium]
MLMVYLGGQLHSSIYTPLIKNSVQKHFLVGLIFAVLGTLTFSGKAIIVKYIYVQYHTPADMVLLLRMAMALPFFLLTALYLGYRDKYKTHKLFNSILLGKLIFLGFIGYYLSSMLDFLGLQYITAGLERIILYLNPTIVMLLGMLIYNRRIKRRNVVAIGVSYLGVLLVFGHELSYFGNHVVWGSLLVLLSCMTYALYLVLSAQWVNGLGALRLASWASSFASGFAIIQYGIFNISSLGAIATIPYEVLLLSFLNAILCTVLPVYFVMLAMEKLGSDLTSQTGMLGMISTIFLGHWILNEPINSWIISGIILVLVGVFA